MLPQKSDAARPRFSPLSLFPLSFSCALIKSLETLRSLRKNFVVAKAHLCPPLENGIQPDTFHAMKFFIFQIGVVNHFRDLVNRLVRNPEPFHERFKRT